MNLSTNPTLHPSFTPIADQLKRRTGLDGKNLDLPGALTLRMQDTGISTIAQYAIKLQTCPDEWQALIETVVIPETSFFRDRQPFEAMSKWIRDTWIKRRHPILRVLSLPCSTGEEAYSIAMTLLNTGLTPAQISIDGIDLSAKSIAVATLGQYRSITHLPSYFSQYWSARYSSDTNTSSESIEILPWVRRLVNFRVGNGLTLLSQPTALPYDLIFCRNLLIYFDTAHRQTLLQGIDRHLSPDGLLVVGHSELGIIDRDRFTPMTQIHSCAFHPVATPKAVLPPRPQRWGDQNRTDSRITPLQPLASESLLVQSKKLANDGNLVEAIEVCDRYLEQIPLCAEGHSLAAQIHLAWGNATIAEQFLDRAIYLDPCHQDSLLQLKLLRSARGDRSGSEAIDRRLKRLTQA